MSNRRTFLAELACSGMMLSHASSSSGSTNKPANSDRPSLGFSLYGMKSLPLPEAVQACAEIGYTHVEFALNEGYPTHPAVFTEAARQAAVAQLKDLGLQLPCLMVNMSLTADAKAHALNLETIRMAGDLAKQLAPKSPPMIETVIGGTPAKWEEQKQGMAAQLKDWAATAQAVHTSIAIKAHIRGAACTPDRLLWLLDSVSSQTIHAAFDYSHFELQGIDLRESLQAMIPRTKFIHVKDTTGNADKFEFLLPGEGKTDYVKYFTILKELGYRGPVCVEVSSQVFNKPNYDPIAAAKSSFAALASTMEKAYSS